MERCENISIATVNGICTEAAYTTDDCSVSCLFINFFFFHQHVEELINIK